MKKNMKNLPNISIITPTLNQGSFIEQTICSIIDQHYPHLEYLIMDGGSTDRTQEIVSKYKKNLTFISEKDTGQSNAINKGMKRVRGDIVGFINSDDYLEPGALDAVTSYFSANPSVMWVTGKCFVIDEAGKEVRKGVTAYKNFFLQYLRYLPVLCVVQFISQPAKFWRRELIEQIGPFDESLHYDMDYDYWLRIWQKYPLGYIDRYLARYRVHTASKAVVSPETQFRVEHDILKRYTSSPITLFLHRIHVQLALLLYRRFWVKRS